MRYKPADTCEGRNKPKSDTCDDGTYAHVRSGDLVKALIRLAALLLGFVFMGPWIARADSPDPGGNMPVPAEIVLRVGQDTYRANGPAECRVARNASIYGIRALLLSVSHSSGQDNVRLSLWQPSDRSADMMTLHVTLRGKTYEVDTVRAGGKRDTKGAGSASFEKVRVGGTFTIDATTSEGAKITGTIKCSRFTGIVAEGG